MQTGNEDQGPTTNLAARIVMSDLLGMVIAIVAIVAVGYLVHHGHYGAPASVLHSIPYPQ
jgi:hypothetical protein